MRIALPPAIAAAALPERGAGPVDLAGATMGTGWRVRLVPPVGCDLAAVRAAVTARLAMIVAQMSQWAPDSLLSRFNRAAPGSWTMLPSDFAVVIAAALRIARLSDGAFDPAIGALVDLWGFGPVPIAAPPDAAAIERARRRSGWRRLSWVPSARCLRQPGGVALDLAGIAKGHAVDAVADRLGALGIAHCLVEIGGELVGRGVRPDGEPWWVDLEAPPGPAVPPLRVALHELAVATSGDYRRGAHTLDPRTGRATTSGVVSVSVIDRSALTADAWATVLTVLPPPAGRALADRHGVAARIVTAAGEELTAALAALLAD